MVDGHAGMCASTISFTPVRVEPGILEMFLTALGHVAEHSPGAEFWFYDDNVEESSSELLRAFATRIGDRATILPELDLAPSDYSRAGATHEWSFKAVDRVAAIKNAAIRRFLETDACHLFLVDADVIVRPELIDHLTEQQVDVVTAVYWTQFRPGHPYLPNVWDSDAYGFDSPESVIRLRSPGHYAVGGLGACTLVDRRVLEAGVDFTAIPSVRMWGEDRHFCIRAGVHGFSLVADTCLTPFHVYRAELLEPAGEWVAGGMDPGWFVERWLTRAWEHAVRMVLKKTSVA